MHELSIAMEIVDLAREAIGKQGGGRVESIHVKIGQLSGVDPDALRSAFTLARETVANLRETQLQVEDVPVVALCPVCAVERTVNFPVLCCPECGTPTPQVLRGRELQVVSLEMES